MSGAFQAYAAPWYLVGGAGEVYAATMYVLGGLGLGLGIARSRQGWRIQMSVLLGLTAMWGIAVAGFLADDGIGHGCTVADHTGEWPSLLVTLAWAGALAAALTRPDPPATRLAIRLAVPILTLAVIGGTIVALVSLQVEGC